MPLHGVLEGVQRRFGGCFQCVAFLQLTLLGCSFLLSDSLCLHRLLKDAPGHLGPVTSLVLTPVVKNHYASQQPNLIPALRTLFATSIASSFSRVSIKHLSNWLDLPVSEVASWAEGAQWTVEGDYAVVPKNEDNNVKAGIVKENVELSRECCRGMGEKR